MPAFDLLDFAWNITPAHHVGNGDPFRYLWYRKKTHDAGQGLTTLHTTVEVGVDGYYVGNFDPTLTLVQYSSTKGADGTTLEDSIQLNIATSDDVGDAPTLDALFGDTWREFLNKVSHMAQEQYALAVSRGDNEPVADAVADEDDITDMLTSALDVSKAAASPEHDECDDALGGLFGEYDPQGGFKSLELDNLFGDDTAVADADADAVQGTVPVFDPDDELDNLYGADASRDTVPTFDPDDELDNLYETDADAAAEADADVYVEESPTEVMVAVSAETEVDEDDALPADLQAVLDKYGPDMLAKLLEK